MSGSILLLLTLVLQVGISAWVIVVHDRNLNAGGEK